jgi:predicted ATP-dependent endonuclease of OLD family
MLPLLVVDPPRSINRVHRNVFSYTRNDYISEQNGEYNERTLLRATLDFHPTVCESLFAKRVVLVEGDTEIAVFSMISELVDKFGIKGSHHKDTTVVSAGGKWTIPAIAKILNEMDIDFRVIHDIDRKGLSDDELEGKSAIHPFKANEKIRQVTGEEKVFPVDDTFEDVLWDQEKGEFAKASDKPFNSWVRVRNYLDGTQDLTPKCESTLKEIVKFAFCD